ncbi:MAG: MATE family efflux transporter [Thermoguttaceae bacterium]|nr:MATE family efflux transporter [Thermoguttaceae bacterium]MDW8078546.1 MATE family efflux transporter [Thermoguttaceae bacterium]
MSRGAFVRSFADKLAHWWHGPCGGRELLRVALPLVASSMSWTIMNFTDRMFLLWYDPACVAAALPAGMILWTVTALPLGVIMFTTTLVGQYEGAGNKSRIGAVLAQAYWSSVAVSPFILSLVPLADIVFRLSGHEPHLAALEATYLRIAALCGPAMLFSGAQSAFFTGRGETKRVMLVDITASFINVILDYLWIFGVLGFPRLGIAGAAWASVVAQWSKVALYTIQMLSPRYREYRLGDFLQLEPNLLKRLWTFGLPNGLQWLLENAAFTLFLLFVGQLGEKAAAATTLAINVNLVAFIPPLGMGMAVTALVAQHLGAGNPVLARRAALTGFELAAAYTAALALLYVLAPDIFLAFYRIGADPNSFSHLRPTVIVLLRFVAAYCVFDAMSVIFSAVLRGAGDTAFLLRVALWTAPFPGLATWLGIHGLGWGLLWAWTVLTLWAWILGVVFLIRYQQGGWEHLRVIEHATQPQAPAFSRSRPTVEVTHS